MQERMEKAVETGSLAFLGGATGSVLVARGVSALNSFLYYGKVQSSKPASAKLGVTNIGVPKSWFTHFYLLSTLLCVALWARFRVFDVVLAVRSGHSVRRLVECVVFHKKGNNSRIQLPHYVVGMGFYVVQAATVWTHLAAAPPSTPRSTLHVIGNVAAVCVIAMGSFYQLQFHRHLAALRKYSLPTWGLFRRVACPHYLCEVALYAGFCALDPTAVTVLSLVWVIVNLGASAEQTRDYYRRKFADSPPYALFPWLF